MVRVNSVNESEMRITLSATQTHLRLPDLLPQWVLLIYKIYDTRSIGISSPTKSIPVQAQEEIINILGFLPTLEPTYLRTSDANSFSRDWYRCSVSLDTEHGQHLDTLMKSLRVV